MKYLVAFAAVGALVLVGVRSHNTAVARSAPGTMPEVVVVADAPEPSSGVMPEVVVRPADSGIGQQNQEEPADTAAEDSDIDERSK